MRVFFLSFLIFFKCTLAYSSLEDNEVVKKYKDANSSVKPDLYGQIHETSEKLWQDWDSFERYMLLKEDLHEDQGLAYMISGALLTIASGIAYTNANSTTEKITYSLGQSLSIGAIGFGAYKYYVGNYDRSFYYIVNSTEGLSKKQRDQLVYHYSMEKSYQKEKLRWISMATYGLIAVVNYINASREEDDDTRDALYTFGGAYTLAFFSVTF